MFTSIFLAYILNSLLHYSAKGLQVLYKTIHPFNYNVASGISTNWGRNLFS
jgi:hypothetical protein